MKRIRILILLLGCLLLAASAIAQFDRAEVLGTVRDRSGAIIPGSTVTLLNQDTGIQSKAITDENGNYDFVNVRIGRYTVTAEMSGFRKFETKDVVVNVNARQRVDVVLEVGAPNEIVEVTGAAAVLETDSSARGQLINTQQVVQLPLNGRNYSDLALLTQWDLGIHKEFPIRYREGMGIQFRSEFFNVLYHSNFRWPDCNFSNVSFGTIRSTYPARQIQFALKVMF